MNISKMLILTNSSCSILTFLKRGIGNNLWKQFCGCNKSIPTRIKCWSPFLLVGPGGADGVPQSGAGAELVAVGRVGGGALADVAARSLERAARAAARGRPGPSVSRHRDA